MIKLIDDYVINVDQYEYCLAKDTHRTNKEGKEIYKPISHYSNLEGAIKGCINQLNAKKLSEGVYELAEAVEIIKSNNKLLSDLLEKHLGGA